MHAAQPLIVSAAAADAATVATDGAAALSCDTTGFIFACTSTARVSRWRRRRRARRMRMRAAPTLATRCARMPDDIRGRRELNRGIG